MLTYNATRFIDGHTVKTSDFHYVLPPELVAQVPLAERSASRLLVVPRVPDTFEDRQFCTLPDLLDPGDLLIFNDTRVIPARLFGRKTTGGRVEILIERVLSDQEAIAQIGAGRAPRPGMVIELDAGATVEVVDREAAFFRLRFQVSEPLLEWLQKYGRLPLPPYIQRDPAPADAERYQTVFAQAPGAVAAPTAGLHFDLPLMERLKQRGVHIGRITLHVGAGTFQPVRESAVEAHQMHAERFEIHSELIEQIRHTRQAGGRVVAVGTTVVRALESALRDGELRCFSGETRIFIYPGYRIHTVDMLITNFHLPESTLLMLVSAFAGRERILAAYRHAIAQHYRFFSYGDAMLLYPEMA